MEQKYVIELETLAVISVTHLNDLQTDIFLFSIPISDLKDHYIYLLQSKI